mmetsp:Transcript_28032/g.71047  ORF Transcript_28032/g.71047 Transcript_28032/m.71047 type:complete len:334 (-) Transcript_28032:707-1708(-)
MWSPNIGSFLLIAVRSERGFTGPPEADEPEEDELELILLLSAPSRSESSIRVESENMGSLRSALSAANLFFRFSASSTMCRPGLLGGAPFRCGVGTEATRNASTSSSEQEASLCFSGDPAASSTASSFIVLVTGRVSGCFIAASADCEKLQRSITAAAVFFGDRSLQEPSGKTFSPAGLLLPPSPQVLPLATEFNSTSAFLAASTHAFCTSASPSTNFSTLRIDCKTALKKHVFPRLTSPPADAGVEVEPRPEIPLPAPTLCSPVPNPNADEKRVVGSRLYCEDATGGFCEAVIEPPLWKFLSDSMKRVREFFKCQGSPWYCCFMCGSQGLFV